MRSKKLDNLKFRETEIVNLSDVDIIIYDAYGVEYLLFPKMKKTILILESNKKNMEK